MLKALSFLVSLASAPAPYTPDAVIAADDQRELPSVEDLSTQPEVFLVSDQRKKDCPRVASVCIFGNGGGTIAGIDVNPTVGIVTTLASGTQVAGTALTGAATQTDAWHVEMIAKFRTRTTSAEPIIVAVMDYVDPDSIVRKEATAVWQIDGAATKDLGMRLVFSAEDGFLPHHTYLIRMVQGVGTNEKILAEGNFMLE